MPDKDIAYLDDIMLINVLCRQMYELSEQTTWFVLQANKIHTT